MIKCPIHGGQSVASLSDDFHELFSKNLPVNVNEVVFYFGDVVGMVHWKCSNEEWNWLKDEMTESYFDEHYDEYLSYPKVECQICLNEYLSKNEIKPEVIKVYITD